MKHWPIVVTAFYFVTVLLLIEASVFLAYDETTDPVLLELIDPETFVDGGWIAWLFIAVIVGCQALLLFLSVDVKRVRLKPQRHVLATGSIATLAAVVLSLLLLWPLLIAIFGENAFTDIWPFYVSLAVFWLGWGTIFYVYRERISKRLDRTVSWLLNGSVLQLLVVVPCHLIVRNRNDCCAPVITGFGIGTGIAIMLMAFGPCVVFLYQRRLSEYPARTTPEPLVHRYPIAKVAATLAISAIALLLYTPIDDGWLYTFGLPSSESAALRADLEALTRASGLSLFVARNGELQLHCADQPVAAAYIRERGSGGLVNESEVRPDDWRISIDPDQPELAAALLDLVSARAREPLFVAEPEPINAWRAYIAYGTFLGLRCTR